MPRRAENGQTVSTDQVFTGLPTGRVVPLCRWCADHEARTSQPVSRVKFTVPHARGVSTDSESVQSKIGENKVKSCPGNSINACPVVAVKLELENLAALLTIVDKL